mgnify:CR=1 FL=1|tara:strand:+ start:69402 stop:70400 length:999 start_codon:yes stop_codon:yes gene_type:complete
MSTEIQTKISKVVNYEYDPKISKQTRAFLKRLNSTKVPPLEKLTPLKARKLLVNTQAVVKVNLLGIETSEKLIYSDGYKFKLDIIRPEGVHKTLPAFIFIHGGGWVLGDFATYKRMVRDLVVLSGIAAVFVNYTPAPEAVFPRAINEIYAASKWVADHGEIINIDGTRLAIVGDSVGGNMTAVTALMAKKFGGPQIKCLIMMGPVLDANFTTKSYQHFGQDRLLTTSLMKWMYDLYIEDSSKGKDIFASPLQASLEDLKDLPPTLIQVAENDVLRDEGEAFARKLDEAGVPVTCIRYNGMIHNFGLLNDLAELPAVQSLLIHAAAELQKHLL